MLRRSCECHSTSTTPTSARVTLCPWELCFHPHPPLRSPPYQPLHSRESLEIRTLPLSLSTRQVTFLCFLFPPSRNPRRRWPELRGSNVPRSPSVPRYEYYVLAPREKQRGMGGKRTNEKKKAVEKGKCWAKALWMAGLRGRPRPSQHAPRGCNGIWKSIGGCVGRLEGRQSVGAWKKKKKRKLGEQCGGVVGLALKSGGELGLRGFALLQWALSLFAIFFYFLYTVGLRIYTLSRSHGPFNVPGDVLIHPRPPTQHPAPLGFMFLESYTACVRNPRVRGRNQVPWVTDANMRKVLGIYWKFWYILVSMDVLSFRKIKMFACSLIQKITLKLQFMCLWNFQTPTNIIAMKVLLYTTIMPISNYWRHNVSVYLSSIAKYDDHVYHVYHDNDNVYHSKLW